MIKEFDYMSTVVYDSKKDFVVFNFDYLESLLTYYLGVRLIEPEVEVLKIVDLTNKYNIILEEDEVLVSLCLDFGIPFDDNDLIFLNKILNKNADSSKNNNTLFRNFLGGTQLVTYCIMNSKDFNYLYNIYYLQDHNNDIPF